MYNKLIQFYIHIYSFSGFPGGTSVQNPPADAGNAGDVGLISGSGRSPGGGNGNPLQYSGLENSTDRSLIGCSPWSRSRTQLSTHAHGPFKANLFLPLSECPERVSHPLLSASRLKTQSSTFSSCWLSGSLPSEVWLPQVPPLSRALCSPP